jgi:hypothetical protein
MVTFVPQNVIRDDANGPAASLGDVAVRGRRRGAPCLPALEETHNMAVAEIAAGIRWAT